MIKIFVGVDERENFAHHVFTQSLIDNSSSLLSITPLNLSKTNCFHGLGDGSNSFTYSRFLIPYLMNFNGWAIFVDGDMVCQKDITDLWNLKNDSFAVLCAKHDYVTKFSKKYLGNNNSNYPRKNWSSVMLWNCAHPSHKLLTPEFIMQSSGAYLHRMLWLNDSDIGDIPLDWNYLAGEYPVKEDANLIHYTIGTPCFNDYKNSDMSDIWLGYAKSTLSGLEYSIS